MRLLPLSINRKFLIPTEFRMTNFGKPLVIAIRYQSGIPNLGIPTLSHSADFPNNSLVWNFSPFPEQKFSLREKGKVRMRLVEFRKSSFGPNWSFGNLHSFSSRVFSLSTKLKKKKKLFEIWRLLARNSIYFLNNQILLNLASYS